MYEVINNIKQIRLLKNYDQAYLADQIGVSAECYSKMENGRTKLTLTQLDKIAKVLEVDPEDFFRFKVSQVFDQCNQKGAYIANNQHFSTDKEIIDRLITVLEKISDRL